MGPDGELRGSSPTACSTSWRAGAHVDTSIPTLSTRKKLLYSLVVIAGFFLVTEVGGRLLLAAVAPEALRSNSASEAWAADGWRVDPDLGWTLFPRDRSMRGGAVCETNSLGLRDEELPLAKPDREFRVLSIGDSTVLGFGVDAQATFSERLESALARTTDRPVEVINAGVAGYASLQTLTYLDLRGRWLSPDVVVFESNFNDRRAVFPGAEPDSIEGFRRFYWRLRLFRVVDNSLLARLIRRLLNPPGESHALLRTGSYDDQTIPTDAPPRVSLEQFEVNLNRVVDVATEIGARPVLVGLPDNPRVVADLREARDHMREKRWLEAELALGRASARPLTALLAQRMLNTLLERTGRSDEIETTVRVNMRWRSTDGYTPVSLSDPYLEAMRRVASERGVSMVVAGTGDPARDSSLYLDYIHLNDEGHALLARQIEAVLVSPGAGFDIESGREPRRAH